MTEFLQTIQSNINLIEAILQYLILGIFIFVFLKHADKIYAKMGLRLKKITTKEVWTVMKGFLLAYLLIFVIFIPLTRIVVAQISVFIAVLTP